jgi:hypothetical protein
MKEEEMGGVCGRRGERGGAYVVLVWCGHLKEKDHSQGTVVDGRIIIQLIQLISRT